MLGRIQWSPDGSQIFFTGPSQVADVVQADGSRLWGIESSGYAGPLRTFDVSADGSKIAYSTCEYFGSSDEIYEIVVSNIDGTEARKRTLYPKTAQNLYPVWSPDGTRMALTRTLPPLDGRRRVLNIGSTDIHIAESDVFQRHPPDGFPSVAMHPPAWSPDGRSVAFLGDVARLSDTGRLLVEGTELHVYRVEPDGSGLERIVLNAVSAPSWSPDSERMAVAVSEGDGAALYTFAADGSDPVMVARIDATDMVDRSGERDPAALWVPNVSWSPDGSKIMYGALSVVNVDDGSVVLDTQLIRFEWVGSYGKRSINHEEAGATPLATWSPDGSRIAVLAPAVPTRQIGYWELERYPVLYTMSSDGTNPRILVGRKDGSMTTWLPPMRLGADPEACSGGVVVPDPDENPGLVEDCRTLLEMRDKITGSGGSLPWSSDAQITQWGVRLGGEPLRVTALHLSEWDRSISGELYGQIPPEIGNLAELRELTIEAAHINGRIPPEIGRLTSLESLELSFTHMGGRIPAEIGKLTNLKRLVLHGSQFSGSIPSEIGKLTNLTHLDLGDNQLTGRIPEELRNLTNLTYVDLYFNRLSGCIPDSHQPRIRRCN